MFESAKNWQGQTVAGKFSLKQYLGGAKHSAVFLTENAGQSAVIKLIAGGADSEASLARLQITAKLAHPQLLRIFEVGRCRIADTDLLYIVMELAQEDLSQILPQRALIGDETQEMLKPVLAALGYLHENGYAHRAVKPSNVLVVNEQVKLSSDGICRIGERAATPAEDSAYLAPEVSRDGFSPASDVWALGATLVQALTQRVPEWNDRLREEPAIPALEAPFQEITRNCLLRDPQRRLTVAQISSRLEPESSRVPARSTQSKWTSRWIYAGAGAVAAIALLIAAFHGVHSSSSPRLPETQTAAAVAPGAPAPVQEDSAATIKRTSVNADEVVRRVMPSVNESALRTIHGKVRVNVRVHLDAAGNVSRAEFATRGPSRYFANAAMRAAQDWKFVPAGSRKQRVWMLQFIFARGGASVHPRRISA
ncbi:MAG TPA: TonB family protein [Terriglobales bacterium]|nr:TonB family protein [Terriglobales bacterium]